MPKPYDHHVKSAQGPGPGNSLESIQNQNLMGMMSPAGRVQSNARTRQPEPVGASLPEPRPGAASSSRAAGGIYDQPGRQAVPAVVPIMGRRMTEEDLLPPAYVRNARPREFWRDTVQPYASAAWNMSWPGIAYNYMTDNQQAVQEGLEDQGAYYTKYLPDAGKAGVNSFLMYDAMERDPVLARNSLQNWAGTSLATGAHALTAAATGGQGNAALVANAGRAGATKAVLPSLASRAGNLVTAAGGKIMSAVPAKVAPVVARAGQAVSSAGRVVPKALYEGAFALPQFSSKLSPGALRTVAGFGEQGAKGVFNAFGSALNPLWSISGSRMAPAVLSGSGATATVPGQLTQFALGSLGRGWGLGNFAQGAEAGLSSAGELLGDNPNASFGEVARELAVGPAQRMTGLPNTAQAFTIPASLLSKAPLRENVLRSATEQGVPVDQYGNVSYPDTKELDVIRSQLEQDIPDNAFVRLATGAMEASAPFKGLETYSQRKARAEFDREQAALNRQGLGSELTQRLVGLGQSPQAVMDVLQRVSPELRDSIYGAIPENSRTQAELGELAASDPQAYQTLANWYRSREEALQSPAPTVDASRRLSQAVDPATMTMLLNDPALLQAVLGPPDQGRSPYGNYATRTN
jgi:hypothetical protein